MENKAQKRRYEIEAIEQSYNSVESTMGAYLHERDYWVTHKKEVLEENPEADTEYYDMHIEENEAKVKAFVKVMEVIYKLM